MCYSLEEWGLSKVTVVGNCQYLPESCTIYQSVFSCRLLWCVCFRVIYALDEHDFARCMLYEVCWRWLWHNITYSFYTWLVSPQTIYKKNKEIKNNNNTNKNNSSYVVVFSISTVHRTVPVKSAPMPNVVIVTLRPYLSYQSVAYQFLFSYDELCKFMTPYCQLHVS